MRQRRCCRSRRARSDRLRQRRRTSTRSARSHCCSLHRLATRARGPALASMQTAIDGLAARRARLLVISEAEDAALRLVPGVPEWLSPLVTVIPGQLLALRLAELRGGDVDHPHGLQKVTLTT